jgi:hypothetical protein
VPQTATITGIVFSIRDESLTAGDSIRAEIYRSTNCGVSFLPTGIFATVIGPNPPNCCAFGSGSLVVNQCDLLSVRVVRTGATGALMNGAAATIILSIP